MRGPATRIVETRDRDCAPLARAGWLPRPAPRLQLSHRRSDGRSLVDGRRGNRCPGCVRWSRASSERWLALPRCPHRGLRARALLRASRRSGARAVRGRALRTRFDARGSPAGGRQRRLRVRDPRPLPGSRAAAGVRAGGHGRRKAALRTKRGLGSTTGPPGGPAGDRIPPGRRARNPLQAARTSAERSSRAI